MTAKMVAEHMKAIFSELRVPKTLVSDNGPCYTGDQFKKTMSHLCITHIKTSPHHHQSNGLAESYVKIIKNLLSKAKETGQDYYEVISVYRSMPLSNDNILPVGSHVMFITPPEKRWHLAIIQEYLGHRSYKCLNTRWSCVSPKQAASQAICSTRHTKEGANQAS